jgi:hypothetical protein
MCIKHVTVGDFFFMNETCAQSNEVEQMRREAGGGEAMCVALIAGMGHA